MARIAFAFDIDGVLVRGKTLIPGARAALSLLLELGIPFIFLTNGGGRTEEQHVELLANRLSLPLYTEQFVQSHTPFHDLVDLYRNKTVLAMGGHGQSVRELAQAYGFKHVVISSDLVHEFPHIHPFPEISMEYHKHHGRKPRRPSAIEANEDMVSSVGNLLGNIPEGSNGSTQEYKNGETSADQKARGLNKAAKLTNGASHTLVRPTFDRTVTTDAVTQKQHKQIEVAAILVWTSPRDWILDLQLITDLLLSSHGTFGSYSPLNGNPDLPNNGYQQDGQPKIYFANPDLAWATPHHLPRFAQGAFQAALEGIWDRLTKGKAELLAKKFGKPTQEMYTYGEKALLAWNEKAYAMSHDGREEPEGMKKAAPKIDKVYMIGDNPDSDICGANNHVSEAGIPWKSILVESGVYKACTKPAHEPNHIAKNVEEAVRWALQQEGVQVPGLES